MNIEGVNESLNEWNKNVHGFEGYSLLAQPMRCVVGRRVALGQGEWLPQAQPWRTRCPEIKELPSGLVAEDSAREISSLPPGLWHLVLLSAGHFILPSVSSSIIFSWEELVSRLIQNKAAMLKSQLFQSYIPKEDLL